MTFEGSTFRVRGSVLAGRCADRIAAWLVLTCLVAGCRGPSDEQRPLEQASKGRGKAAVARTGPEGESRSPGSSGASPARSKTKSDDPAEESRSSAEIEQEASGDWPEPQRVESVAQILKNSAVDPAETVDLGAVETGPVGVQVDEARAAAAGIRKVSGRRLTLFTDLPPSREVDVLPEVFEQAFPQWCDYFGIDPADHPDWSVTGFLMEEKGRFQQAGLFPEALPPFEHGFSWNYDLWVYEQPSDYYRRHLLLHEGTHSFMNTLLGGCGAPWYMEGIAELLSTHRWHDGRLTLNYLPATREEVPLWGRIGFIQDAFAAHRAIPVEWLIEYDPKIHPANEAYAWCWAAAALMDRHPRYRDRFRQLRRFVRETKSEFSDRFRRLIGDQWNELSEQWQVFVGELEYGHDIPKTVVDFTPGQPLPAAGASVEVAADRGWQNSGLRLEAGVAYQVRASGRYQVAGQPRIWWCEPGGVSIRYYKGRPLGIVLAAVRPEPPPAGEPSALLHPVAVGPGTTLTPKHSGTLFLRINDSAAELEDNAGTLVVHVTKAAASSDNRAP